MLGLAAVLIFVRIPGGRILGFHGIKALDTITVIKHQVADKLGLAPDDVDLHWSDGHIKMPLPDDSQLANFHSGGHSAQMLHT